MRRLAIDLEMMLFIVVLWLCSLDECGQNKSSTVMHLCQRSSKPWRTSCDLSTAAPSETPTVLVQASAPHSRALPVLFDPVVISS